jgi:NAD(P)-dependent dehydrogenase (short-subunit alcohol dehydrogenase family)
MFDFSGRVAIVTGASGNLGAAVASAFHQAGAKMVLVDRAPDRLQRLFPRLADSPDYYLATSADLTDAEAVDSVVEETISRFGRIDVLANAVGGYRAGVPVHETQWQDWEFLLTLNAKTAFLTSKAVVPHMLNQGAGKIVHVSARSALKGGARSVAYSASKCVVVRLVESMAAELRHDNININCVLPGTIDTPQNRQSMPGADHTRWVPPEAIANVILFLTSDAAWAVNGAAVPVYGRS